MKASNKKYNVLNEKQIKIFFTELKNRVEFLSLDYDKQCRKSSLPDDMIPNDTATDWDYVLSLANDLLKNKILDESIIEALETIDRKFIDVSLKRPLFEEKIWTGEGLKNHSFWNQQRKLAEKVLIELNKINLD